MTDPMRPSYLEEMRAHVAAPDLAKSIAEFADAALAKATKP